MCANTGTIAYMTKTEYSKNNKGKCNVLLNEIMPTYVNEEGVILRHYQFIELIKKCGSGAKPPVKNSLDGYMIFIIEFGTHKMKTTDKFVPIITFAADLTGSEFHTRAGDQYFYTVGNVYGRNMSFDTTFANPNV